MNEKETVNRKQYDVAIVGASIGGITAAIMYAREGLSVALIERSADIDAYKKACTHFLQPETTPILQGLGVAEKIEAVGGQRNSGRAWTRYGWIGPGYDPNSYGYNIRRELLDPLMRRQAGATPGVDLMLGTSLTGLVYEGDRVVGFLANRSDRTRVEIRAKLVVGADGRHSRTAQAAKLPVEEYANQRFAYFAYYRHVTLSLTPGSQVWYLDPDAAYALPNDNGLTLLVVMLSKERLAAFKQDPQGNFDRFWADLPDGPDMSQAEQVSELRGMLNMPNLSREPIAPGLALVGDAAKAPDPLWGNGISWALQSATWLVQHTAGALRDGRVAEVDRALEQYRQEHEAKLGGRFAREVDFARARPFNFVERLMYAATTRDSSFGRHTGPHSLRLANLRYLPPAKAILQALWVNVRHELRQFRQRQRPFAGDTVRSSLSGSR
jgi:2-polyprenyl-6-methoxyphenol hydroxylase-like FAD-dependent oxidoreductase